MNNPGWVDLQVNGHNGVNFSDPELTESEFLRRRTSCSPPEPPFSCRR